MLGKPHGTASPLGLSLGTTQDLRGGEPDPDGRMG